MAKKVKKKAKKKRPAAKKTKTPKKKTAKTKAVPRKKKKAKTKAKKSTTGKKKAAAKKTATMPRPKIPADAKLYLLFKEDYHARQIFTFLRVETVKELEAYRAEEIVDKLTAPIVGTVERIREKLAENNRCLAGDERQLRQLKKRSK